MLLQGGHAFPVTGYAAQFDRFAARRLDPGWATRLVARLRSRALDRALIRGADPSATPRLAARAASLTSTSMRRHVAGGLESLAATERTAHTRWQLLPSGRAVAANAFELHALAARLRGPGPVYAQGIAMLRRLLTDGTGPAYTDRRGELLADRLRDARVAIGA